MFSKKIRIAINGFGRIGRNAFKIAFEKKKLEIVAVNDLTDAAMLAHLLRHDSNYGLYERQVAAKDKDRGAAFQGMQVAPQGVQTGELFVSGKKMLAFSEKDPAKLPWKKLKVDVVLECTGRFTNQTGASMHLKAGAKKVIVSAPAKGGNIPTFIRGVNNKSYGGEVLINNASCTTNCISPVAQVMHSKFGIKKAMMTTVHAYTADQNLQDGPHADLRRARTAGLNIVPTTTGAAIATTEAIPDLKGKFDGFAIRVPVSVVSISDFTFLIKRKATAEEVSKAFIDAAKNPMYKNILAVVNEPLVSSDFIKNSYSAVVDLLLTKVVDGDMVKVVAWYDNEWGYANRLVEMAEEVG